jgi:hypothetical protein
MLGIRNATQSVTDSANAIERLSDDVRDNLSEWSDEVKGLVGIATIAIGGAVLLSVAALIISLVAVARRD